MGEHQKNIRSESFPKKDTMAEKIEKVAVAQVTPDELQINIASVEVQDGYLGKLALYKVRYFFRRENDFFPNRTRRTRINTQVVTNDKNHHKDVVLMKRYNQFADLDAKLTGKYKDTHMFEKHFPKLSAYAPKKMKLLTDHFSKEFLTERRYALTDWLNSLSEFPGMSQDPIFRTFLGVPAIRA